MVEHAELVPRRAGDHDPSRARRVRDPLAVDPLDRPTEPVRPLGQVRRVRGVGVDPGTGRAIRTLRRRDSALAWLLPTTSSGQGADSA